MVENPMRCVRQGLKFPWEESQVVLSAPGELPQEFSGSISITRRPVNCLSSAI